MEDDAGTRATPAMGAGRGGWRRSSRLVATTLAVAIATGAGPSPATAAGLGGLLDALFGAPAPTSVVAPGTGRRHGPRTRRTAGRGRREAVRTASIGIARPRVARPGVARFGAPSSAAEAGGGGGSVGLASYYAGGRTASGGRVGAATCAHRWLPFGTIVRVTNLLTRQAERLVVNDRGPFKPGRIIDVSRAAAPGLGLVRSGVARVRVEVVASR